MVYNKDCLALIHAIGIKNFFKGENENEKNVGYAVGAFHGSDSVRLCV